MITKKNQRINPVTIRCTLHKSYHLASIIDRISDKDTPFLDDSRIQKTYQQLVQDVYFPLFSFINLFDLKVNLIVSGEFLDYTATNNPRLLALLSELVSKESIILVADAYHGDSLTSIYNSSLWARRLMKTNLSFNKHFEKKAEMIFMPQLYRNLEMEKISSTMENCRFLLRNRGNKIRVNQIKLSQLRKFNGNTVNWINEENDKELQFFYVPDNMFREVNDLIFEKDKLTATRAFGMDIGLKYSKFLLKRTRRAGNEIEDSMRINEKPSFYLYNQLQRSVLRMWEYAAFLISTELNNSSGDSPDFVKGIAKKFAGFQDPFYLKYLDTKLYLNNDKLVQEFSSPYEAYVNMQACVKNIEILLKNRV